MRLAFAALVPWLLPIVGSSQASSWVHTADSVGVSDYFYDGICNGERYILARQTVMATATATVSNSEIRAVSDQGALQNSVPFNPYQRFVTGALLPRAGTSASEFIATSQPSNDWWRVERYVLDGSGNPMDTTASAPDSLQNLFLENAARTADGGTVLALAASPASIPMWFTRLLLLRLTSEGDSSTSFTYDYPFGNIYPYDIIERSPDTILIASNGGIEAAGTAFNIASITAVNRDLQPFGGMSMIAADGSGAPLISSTPSPAGCICCSSAVIPSWFRADWAVAMAHDSAS